MRTYWILLRRELGAYFVFLSGYVVIAAAAFLMGLGFLNMVIAVRGETMLVPVTELFYQTPYFWMIVLLTSPIITMRLFALEKYAGTFETLMTTPVRDTAVVLAKFSAALRPGGVLFVGGTEILSGAAKFGLQNFGISFYKKL